MDKTYCRKIVKFAIASPLALSLALVLDINQPFSFFVPLMMFIVTWKIPLDSFQLKRSMILTMLPPIVFCQVAAALMVSFWGLSSVVLFLYFTLTGTLMRFLMPTAVRIGLLSTALFLSTLVITSASPLALATQLSILFSLGLGSGWLLDRLFWPVSDEQNIELQVSKAFRILQTLSEHICQSPATSPESESWKALTAQASQAIQGVQKQLAITAAMGSLPPPKRAAWTPVIVLQARLFAHQQAIARLLRDTQGNPLLQALEPELTNLHRSLSASCHHLSVAVLSKHESDDLPFLNLNADWQRWQTRLSSMQGTGSTQAFDLSHRLAVGLIDYRLQGLVNTLADTRNWFDTVHPVVMAQSITKLKLAS